jgi:hypothetical protein
LCHQHAGQWSLSLKHWKIVDLNNNGEEQGSALPEEPLRSDVQSPHGFCHSERGRDLVTGMAAFIITHNGVVSRHPACDIPSFFVTIGVDIVSAVNRRED